MDGRPELARFLRTDPRDVGCAQAMEMLHIYAERPPPAVLWSSGTRASPRTCALAARAVKTLTGCWPPCATRNLSPLTDIRRRPRGVAPGCARGRCLLVPGMQGRVAPVCAPPVVRSPLLRTRTRSKRNSAATASPAVEGDLRVISFDSPTAIADGRINLCDLFVFPGVPGTTTLILTVNPDAGRSSATTFRPDALYEFVVATDGGTREDIAFRVTFTEPDNAGTQQMRVLRADGAAARHGTEGRCWARAIPGTSSRLVSGAGVGWTGRRSLHRRRDRPGQIPPGAGSRAIRP